MRIADARSLAAPACAALLLLLAGSEASATAGLPELRRNTGARGTALADAMVAVLDVEAASANPAALAPAAQRSAAVDHTAWIQDMRLSQIAVVGRRGRTVWGLSAQVFQADGLERRTGPSVEPLGEFGVYDAALTFTAARQWKTRIRLGASGHLIRQSVATAAASGAAADLGILAQIAPDLHAAVAVRHLGAMGKLQSAATELPTVVRGGLAFAGIDRVLLSFEAQRARGADSSLHGGAELSLTPELAVRVGYRTADSTDLTAGLGLRWGPWSVDYAYIPFAANLGAAHHLGVQLHR